MATYKVLQDIEAEDKLLGPLSLRQFIYAIIVIVIGFIAFQLARATWFLALPFVPPMVFFGLLAAPIGQNQSSEVWLLAKIRFFIFPRRRIWDQTGVQDLVTITAPKTVETNVTKGYSREEVTSRLQALANTLDTRGWAIKNATSGGMQTLGVFGGRGTTDRLVEISDITGPTDSPAKPSDDVLDTNTSPVAQQMNQMIQDSTELHRLELLDKVRKIASKHQPDQSTTTSVSPATQTVANPSAVPSIIHPAPQKPEPTPLPQPILNNSGEIVHSPEPTVQPSSVDKQKTSSTMTSPASTDILKGVESSTPTSVSVSHDDSSNSTDGQEVVISLR